LSLFGQDKQGKESLNKLHYKDLEMKYKMISKCVFFLGFLFFSGLSLFLRTAGEPQEALKERGVFGGLSYALIIGIDNYENWTNPDNAIKDGVLVGKEFESRGFYVTYINVPTLSELENALKEFFYNDKIDNKSRLFIWYSGHGHTIDVEGFLVPVDAASSDDTSGFIRKALPVERFKEYSRYTKAKHVYMVFDSCFSSTIFKQGTDKSPEISIALKGKVRQFLCSGNKHQKGQDKSYFRDTFLKAIKNEVKANANEDDYLTASEIGLYIKDLMKETLYLFYRENALIFSMTP
jgi:hypothetical protein